MSFTTIIVIVKIDSVVSFFFRITDFGRNGSQLLFTFDGTEWMITMRMWWWWMICPASLSDGSGLVISLDWTLTSWPRGWSWSLAWSAWWASTAGWSAGTRSPSPQSEAGGLRSPAPSSPRVFGCLSTRWLRARSRYGAWGSSTRATWTRTTSGRWSSSSDLSRLQIFVPDFPEFRGFLYTNNFERF